MVFWRRNWFFNSLNNCGRWYSDCWGDFFRDAWGFLGDGWSIVLNVWMVEGGADGEWANWWENHTEKSWKETVPCCSWVTSSSGSKQQQQQPPSESTPQKKSKRKNQFRQKNTRTNSRPNKMAPTRRRHRWYSLNQYKR